MFEKELQDLGLTEGESKVYEAMLVIGPSKVGPIVKKSGIAYSNIYEVLDRLIEKGLASFVTREKTKVFQAVEPHRIFDFLEKQEMKVLENKKMLGAILPRIKGLASSTEPLDVEIFEGLKGLRTAYDRLLEGSTSKEVEKFFYVHEERYLETVLNFYAKLGPSLKKSKAVIRGISSRAYTKSRLSKTPEFITSRWVPFPVPGNIDMFRDRVLIVTWGEKPVGILIHSKAVATYFQRYFDEVWKIAKT